MLERSCLRKYIYRYIFRSEEKEAADTRIDLEYSFANDFGLTEKLA